MQLPKFLRLEYICKEVLGKRNDPMYTVVSIAVLKGICSPLITMSDKKQDKKTKTYAAIREGTTELVAIPTYVLLSKLVERFAPAFAVGKDMTKALESSKKMLGFLGVCTAAILVIPSLCNLVIPHVIKACKSIGNATHKNADNSPEKPSLNAGLSVPADAQILQMHAPVSPYRKTSISTGGGMRV